MSPLVARLLALVGALLVMVGIGMASGVIKIKIHRTAEPGPRFKVHWK